MDTLNCSFKSQTALLQPNTHSSMHDFEALAHADGRPELWLRQD